MAGNMVGPRVARGELSVIHEKLRAGVWTVGPYSLRVSYPARGVVDNGLRALLFCSDRSVGSKRGSVM